MSNFNYFSFRNEPKFSLYV